MAILAAVIQKGINGDEKKKIVNYSPSRKNLFYEGVSVAFESDTSDAWIGNFDDEHRGSHLLPFLSKAGIAFIFAGPYCYIVSGAGLGSFKTVESFNASDDWIQFSCGVKGEEIFLACGSKGGKIVILSERGDVRATTGVGICEDLTLAISPDGVLIGKFFEFNLNKWVDFKFNLPDLTEA